MKLERQVQVEATREQATKRVHAFFASTGYRPARGKALVYERGSLLGSWTGFEPRRWFTRATVTLDGSAFGPVTVRLDLHVNASGQMVTPEENAYWESELARFDEAMRSGAVDNAALASEAATIQAKSTSWVVQSVGGMLLGGVVLLAIKFIQAKWFT